MTDSFFSSKNHLDDQMQGLPSIVCEQFIEASVRRIAKLDGPFEAAKRLQRLADICAGAYVLPIDHWHKLETPKVEPTKIEAPKPTGPGARLMRMLHANAGVQYWIGFVTGYIIGRS